MEASLEASPEAFDPLFCVVLVAWMAAQVAVLLAQKRWGPRVMVPLALLPKIYDYNRKIPEKLIDSDCAVCMMSVNGVDAEHMLTPCNHLFHRDCLKQWLEHKHECPTCRAQLPTL